MDRFLSVLISFCLMVTPCFADWSISMTQGSSVDFSDCELNTPDPVIGDGLMQGGTTDDGNFVATVDNVFYFIRKTPTTLGNVSFGLLNCQYQDSANVAIYTISGDTATLLVDGPGETEMTDNKWVGQSLDSTVELTNQEYIFGLLSDDGSTGRWNSSAGGEQVYSIAMTYGASAAASFTISEASKIDAENPMIVFNNTGVSP